MHRLTSRIAPAVVVLSLVAAACGDTTPKQDAVVGAEEPTTSTRRPAASVKTASVPSDACGWIAASDVEQVIGKLEGAPRAAGNECTYTLVEKSASFARLLEMRKQFGGGDAGDHDFQDVVKVAVDLSGGSITADLAGAAVGRMFAKEFGLSGSDVGKKAPPPPGWDKVGGMPYTWIGRVGHISISVFSPPEISNETKMALAARVRDRIPDLPFPAENTYQIVSLGGADRSPCDLLTRSEAEAVLGALVVEPYRSIEDTSFVYEKGNACAYFTPGHRAFVLTPEWSDGATTFNMSRGIGGLIGAAVPLEKTRLEGPWDNGMVDGMTGALMFLKGERMLRVDYLTSGTDRDGALKLAALAMQRLAS